jgi:hypothetical protein
MTSIVSKCLKWFMRACVGISFSSSPASLVWDIVLSAESFVSGYYFHVLSNNSVRMNKILSSGHILHKFPFVTSPSTTDILQELDFLGHIWTLIPPPKKKSCFVLAKEK